MQRLHGLRHPSQGNTNATRKFFPVCRTTSKNVESQYIEVPAFNAKPVLCIFSQALTQSVLKSVEASFIFDGL